MKPAAVGIFAHPDDESFGPGGTIAKLAKSHDFYLVCATCGESGQNNSDKNAELSKIRIKELQAASKILGVKEVFFLNFKDGTLSNNLYHDLAGQIEIIVKKLNPQILMTFEPHGVSGHIDHITISMVTTYIFKKNPSIEKLMYYCILDKRREKYLDDYFIYFPPGYREDEIDEVVDTTETMETRIKAIQAHESQKADGIQVIKSLRKLGPNEYFQILINPQTRS